MSHELGLRLQKIRLISAAIGVLVAAITDSAVGTVSFLDFLVPQVVHLFMRQHHQKSAVHYAILSAILLTDADVIGKTIRISKKIASGFVDDAIIGAPNLLFFMYRSIIR